MTTTRKLAITVLCSGALLTASVASAGGDKEDHFKMMDSDGDGQISRTEHAAGAREMFTKCDVNTDGQVTAAEMDQATAAMRDKHDTDAKTAAEKIKMIDQNSDGQLTAAEHDAGSATMFGKLDTDGDGMLSKSEYKAGMKMKKKDT